MRTYGVLIKKTPIRALFTNFNEPEKIVYLNIRSSILKIKNQKPLNSFGLYVSITL